MVKVGAAVLVSFITITLVSSYLFADNPDAYRFVVQVAGFVFVTAFLFCILKGFVFGFGSVVATASLSRVLGIDVLIILAVFIISQANACASTLFGV